MKSYISSSMLGIRTAFTVIIVATCCVTGFCQASADTPTLKQSPALTHIITKQGQKATDVFTFTAGGSFQGDVTVSITGLPSFVTASWSSDPVSIKSGAGSSTLTLVPAITAKDNWYTFTVVATGDGVTISNLYVIEVEPAIGVAVGLSNPALTIEPQSTATMLVTATPINGVKLPVGGAGATAAIVSSLPSGITAKWSSPTVTTAGAVNWTLALTASATAATASDPINLAIQIVDKNSGLSYAVNSGFPLLVSLLAEVNITDTPGLAISPTFMGLSLEWNDAQKVMGDSTVGVNNIFRQLLTNLTVYGSGPMNIRIGGDSTDTTGEPSSTTAQPFAELAKATGARFELGVNLGADNVKLAVNQAKAYVSQMPAGSLEAIEIGNEPDEYYKNGMRPSTYTVQDYYTDFATWKENIMPLLSSGTKLMAASWAFLGTMKTNAATFEALQSTALTSFSQHCYATSPNNNPAPDFLLSPSAASSVPLQVAAAAAMTHTNGVPFRMGETGPVSDEGIQNISDSFSAALWSMDYMFEYASLGIDGVNWFATSGNPDSPFQFSVTTSKGMNSYQLASVNPLYYGLLMFQIAVGDGANLLPVTLSTEANLKAWATRPAGRNPRVAIINKDEAATGNVAVTMPGYSSAVVLRLTAPSYESTSGVTFAGQTFDGSNDGRIRGTKTLEPIDAVNGIFSIPMGVTSAALVIFSH